MFVDFFCRGTVFLAAICKVFKVLLWCGIAFLLLYARALRCFVVFCWLGYIIRLRGSPQRINKSPWGRCLQGVVDARWVTVVGVVCCCLLFLLLSSSLTGGSFWTNCAEAHGQLVLSPVRLPEQLRSSRLVDLAPNFA